MSAPAARPGPGVGAGVFETLELRLGAPFALTRHLDRLHRGARALGLPVPEDRVLRGAVGEVAAAWGERPGRLRITVTATGRLLVAAAPMVVRTEPVDVVLSQFPRNDRGALHHVKSTAYADNVTATSAAAGSGAGEVLLANTEGLLCEGTGSNVVVGIDGRLCTPPLSSGCLGGITRELLLEALERAGRPAVITEVPATRLGTVDEAFLVSTGRRVQPVASIDGRALPSCPGPLTEEASRIWQAAYDGIDDP